MTIKQGWTGRVYEDFEVGDIYQHPLGRTVLAAVIHALAQLLIVVCVFARLSLLRLFAGASRESFGVMGIARNFFRRRRTEITLKRCGFVRAQGLLLFEI